MSRSRLGGYDPDSLLTWRFLEIWIGWGKTFPAETKQAVFFGEFLVEKFGEIILDSPFFFQLEFGQKGTVHVTLLKFNSSPLNNQACKPI